MDGLKPFHKSIVDAIKGTFEWERLNTLGKLITTTEIPKDHDLIIEAWNHQVAETGVAGPWHPVVESLEAQKRLIEAKALDGPE